MSDINANIVVSPIDLGVVVNTNQLTFTPEAISLNLYAGGVGTSNALSANIANVHIFGGVNGYVLQTDGTGNLTWTAQTGNGGGNGTPGGSNTQVQYNNAGNFGGTAGFTFDSTTGNLSVPNNVIAPNFIGNASYATTAGYAPLSDIANIAIVANSVAGANVSGTVANATYATTAGSANTANIANTAINVPGANVSSQVANSLIAGTVYTNAQPNITSVGTLTSLSLVGTGSVQQIQEKITSNATAATGTINYNLLDQAIIFNTANATANFTLNFRGNSSTTLNSIMSSNQSMTCTFINTNGGTPYYPTIFNVDGNTVTTKWQGDTGAAPVATGSSTSIYNFNIIKTAANTFNIFASGAGYI